MRARRLLTLPFLSVALVLALAAPAIACSCAALSKPELGRQADVVFTGKAVRVSVSGTTLLARFVVLRLFKGDVPDEVDVTTTSTGAACGYRFEQGGRYTVFGLREGRRLTTSLCTGTTVGDVDPAAYGLVARSTPSGTSFLTYLVGAVLMGAAVWAILRRRRDARWGTPPDTPS